MVRTSLAAVVGCALVAPAVAQPRRSELPPGPLRPAPAPRRLLDAPVFTIRPQGALAAFAGEGVDIVVGWRAVGEAASYRVTLAGGSSETTEDATTLRFERHGLQPGRYQLTVTALDATGTEGVISEPLPLTIVEVRAVPPGADKPLPPTRGAYALGTRFSVPGMHCETSHAAIDDLLVLPENDLRITTPGLATLRCAGIPGYLEKQVVIAPVTLAVDSNRVARGTTTTVHVTLASVAFIGEHLDIEAHGDITLGEAERTEFGLEIPVTAPPTAHSAALSIQGSTFQLGHIDLVLVDSPPPPPAPLPAVTHAFALDLGGQVGAFFPPSTGGAATTIGHPMQMADVITSGPLIGARLGFFPSRRVGLEGELSMLAGGYGDEAGVSQILASRVQLAVRALDRGRFGLRLIGGTGAWTTLRGRGTSSRGSEGAIHAGAAFTVETSPNLWLRFQLADLVTSARDDGYAHVIEAQLGIFTRFGRRDSF